MRLRFWLFAFTTFGLLAQEGLALSQNSARFIVAYRPTARLVQKDSVLGQWGKILHHLNGIHAVTVQVKAESEKEFLAQTWRDRAVRYIVRDRILHMNEPTHPALLPANPINPQQIPWGIAEMNAPRAWSKTQGAGVKSCVLDTGVDFLHSDLGANVVDGINIIDPTVSYRDDHSHGTHVAGIIAALNNGFGVVGIAPQSQILAAKVLSAQGSGQWSDIAKAMEWCFEHGARVMNLSLGAEEGDQAMEETIKDLYAKGAVIVAAAGNETRAWVDYPAAYAEVIAVSASTEHGLLAKFSNYEKKVEFIAPGDNVMSTVLDDDYWGFSGTSMATPHVVGAAVLALSQNPKMTPGQVRQALADAAFKLRWVSPGFAQGHGMIDTAKLVGAR